MWTKEKIRDFLNEVGAKMEAPIEVKCEIKISSRLRTTWAKVTYQQTLYGNVPLSITVSEKLLKYYAEEDIKQVLMHELAHYYLIVTDPYERHGHDKAFREVCRSIGCTHLHSTNSLTPIKEIPQTDYKYKLICSCCGATVGYRKSKCKVVKNPELYTSSCCHAELEVEEL